MFSFLLFQLPFQSGKEVEYYDILDQNGNPTGETARRAEVHARGLRHGSVHLWIYNSRGDLLLQKRDHSKDSHPGLWDVSVAGHINTGEDPETAALREAGEELGLLIARNDLIPHRRRPALLVSRGGRYIDREITWVFLLRRDEPATCFSPRPGEVAEVRWFRHHELEEMLRHGSEPLLLVPHEKHYYREILDLVRRGW